MRTCRTLPHCIIMLLMVLASLQLSAQTESMDTSRWISPDIPREGVAFRTAARSAAQTLAVTPGTNPDIPQSLLCQDLRVVFVLDESGSITGSEITSVENGALALANALLNSGATLQLVEFNTTSSVVNLGVTQVNSTFISRLTSYLGSGYNGQTYNPVSANPCTGWTNWQDAMEDVAGLNADLVIFFTDGNPTAYNVASGGNCTSGTVSAGQSNSLSLDAAVTQANVLKAQGKHLFVVGVGNSSEINLDNIKAISGNDVFGPSHDILTADYTTPPFEGLAANLTAAVNAICGTELLVDKTASNSGVCSGQAVTFTNTVTNTGGDFNFTALSVVAKDVYPSGYSNLQFVPSAPAGASISGNTVTYNIGDMTAGQTVTYKIRATVLAPVPPKVYNNVIAAPAFNANEVRDSVTVVSGYATASMDTTSCVPVTINGNTYSSNGTYTQTLVSTAGCDSILSIHLTIAAATSSSETMVTCDTYTWPLNGTTYTESGTYTYSTTSAAGCVHNYTLNLTINKSTGNTSTATACDSYTWAVNGVTYTESGTYSVYSLTAAGCRHTETLELTINKSTSNTTEAAACDSYTWAVSGVTYYQSGTYEYVTTTDAGCTHTEKLALTINESTSNVTTAEACGSYVWSVNGNTYTESGFYTSVSVNAAGCPYTEALSLTINQGSNNTVYETACDSYTWAANGQTYTESGSYSVSSTTPEGCTSTETLELTINKSTSNTTVQNACGSYYWPVNGVTYTESGIYTAGSTNASGCPHTETLELTIGNGSSNTTPVTTCDRYTWALNGITYTESGIYTVNSTNEAGCTHAEILQLTINKSTSHTAGATACNSYTWSVNGVSYTETGTYTATSVNAAGCTHTETLVLKINKSTSKTTTATACGSYVWTVNGVTYTQGGTYVVYSTNADGCPHTETLLLTIGSSTSNTSTVTACDSYKWAVNGVTYTQGGTYTVNSTNASGCTHTEKLVLTIGKGFSKTTTITACNSYKWAVNNVTYTIGGTYRVNTTNSSGCTCTEILVLTINTAPVTGTLSGPLTVCRSQSGLVYTVTPSVNATSYTWLLPTGITGTSTTNSITVSVGSTFSSGTIQVKANNTCGSGAYAAIAVKAITALPSACAGISGTKVYCAAGNYSYSIPLVTNATSYVWTVTGTGLSITSGQGTNGIMVTVTSAFVSGTVSVKAVNCLGSCAVVSINVSASRIPAIPGAISGPVAGLCKKTNVVYSIAAVPGATSYSWAVPAGASIVSGQGTTSVTVSYSPSITGSCTINVKAVNACGSSNAATLAVTMVPATPTARSGSLSVTRSQTAVVYSVNAVPDATSYSWSITGGARFTGSTTGNTVTVNFSTATSTTAIISVKANNACGSSAAGTATVSVAQGYAARGTGGNDLLSDELTAAATNYVVYPNPNNGQFNIGFNTLKMDKVSIVIADLTGRVVYSSSNTYQEGPQVSKINLTKVAKGAYFVRMVKNNEQQKVIKVFVE